MKNIKDRLWDECNDNVEAYETRREFYGYLSPSADEDIEIDSFDLDCSYSTLMNEDEYFYDTPRRMDDELWEYSLKGVSALKIY